MNRMWRRPITPGGSMLHRLRERGRADVGFTLIELLMVIIIICVLATIAIPTYLGQKGHAQDAAAYTLVRNALTAMQGVFVDTSDYTLVTDEALTAVEPSIHWVRTDANLVGIDPPWIRAPLAASAARGEVAYYVESTVTVDLASVSDSGNSFGIQVDVLDLSRTDYVKVKSVGGETVLGW